MKNLTLFKVRFVVIPYHDLIVNGRLGFAFYGDKKTLILSWYLSEQLRQSSDTS